MLIESYMHVFANVYRAQTHVYIHAYEYTSSTHRLPNLLVLHLPLQRPALVASTRVKSATLHGRAQCRCMCAAPRWTLHGDTDLHSDPARELVLLQG